MNSFLSRVYWGNTVINYCIAVLILLTGLLALHIIKGIVMGRLEKWAARTTTTIDDFLVKIIEKTGLPILYVLFFYGAVNYLILTPEIRHVMRNLMIVVVTFFILRLGTMLIEYALTSYLQHNKYEDSRRKEVKGMILIIKIVLWSVAIVFLLDNFGYNVTTIITGLGIGGVAIALASQNILSDLFCYFVIFFDRPFEIGDFIIVGDKMGGVEHIGIKTTRLRSLGGEELIFSNKDLTDSRIHNYKRMQKRRILFQIDVVYETTPEMVEKIPQMLREIVESVQNLTFDRAHFASYGAFSLKYEVVYYVLTGDYNKYMDIQQEINFKIFRKFTQLGIGFAYPTQTLLMPGVEEQMSGLAK
jgi:small-conductance mechanosensitive channel